MVRPQSTATSTICMDRLMCQDRKAFRSLFHATLTLAQQSAIRLRLADFALEVAQLPRDPAMFDPLTCLLHFTVGEGLVSSCAYSPWPRGDLRGVAPVESRPG